MSEVPESIKYQDMLQEVEQLVKDVSSPGLDLDLMVNKVERGYHLIQMMQERLESTKERIQSLSQKYENASEPSQ